MFIGSGEALRLVEETYHRGRMAVEAGASKRLKKFDRWVTSKLKKSYGRRYTLLELTRAGELLVEALSQMRGSHKGLMIQTRTEYGKITEQPCPGEELARAVDRMCARAGGRCKWSVMGHLIRIEVAEGEGLLTLPLPPGDEVERYFHMVWLQDDYIRSELAERGGIEVWACTEPMPPRG